MAFQLKSYLFNVNTFCYDLASGKMGRLKVIVFSSILFYLFEGNNIKIIMVYFHMNSIIYRAKFITIIGIHTVGFLHIILWRPRMYEHLGRNPGINGWQIYQPVTINMCTSFCVLSRVPYFRGINILSSTILYLTYS
jgi:hypothetical protein